MSSPNTRHRLTVTGVVQGVGFRPFIYGLALAHNLAGYVGNNSAGVFIEVEGQPVDLQAFTQAVSAKAPPLAIIESVRVQAIPPSGETAFTIVHSESQTADRTLISPDICICPDCLHEIFDTSDRRFAYPFTNCTNCGPRFTIIQDIPYDRPLTTMRQFLMCPACQAEYENPLDRRFHAQPNACPVCGPAVWLESRGSPQVLAREAEALSLVKTWLHEGKILAIKGLGGFHLACDAANDQALAVLRERKGRVAKPFAVMAADLTAVHEIAELSPAEEALLTSKERPILLLRKKPGSPLSHLVAPGNPFVGVLLPYTPLHYLLLTPRAAAEGAGSQPPRAPILVMTSANFSDEPIVKDNDEARDRLALLADGFLLHNREIHARCDDSVLRLLEPSPGEQAQAPAALLPLRRSRGYAPFPVRLPFAVEPLLAVGGELKATFCLAAEAYAYMSQHIGDMENLETLEAFEAAVAHFEHIFRLQPQRIAADLHPGYLSTRWAFERGLPVTQVQHHHAHIAAVLAEHQIAPQTPVIGFSFDGTGYGPDGAIWGGEVLLADYQGFERAAHLAYLPIAGGDAAIKRPYRLALAYLWALDLPWDERLPAVAAASPEEKNILRRQLETGLNVVQTSSMGRLFDAVAALIGVRQVVTYEAQAAIEMEALARSAGDGQYPYAINAGEIEVRSMLAGIIRDLLAGDAPGDIAARFHNTIAALILDLSLDLRRRHSLNQVALSGGVFQNITLLQKTLPRLRAAGFEVLTHRLVPPNDGGLALGQAVIAAAQH